MTLSEFSELSQVVGAVAVVASLLFVGVQLSQNTRQMKRGEANSAMAQGSALRHLLMNNREFAQLLISGLGGAPLEAADELRLNALFAEITYMSRQVLDRAKNGLVDDDEFEREIIPQVRPLLTAPRGIAWWRAARSRFPSDFVAAMERSIPVLAAPAAPSKPVESGPAAPAGAG
jgi:hypothetical protein